MPDDDTRRRPELLTIGHSTRPLEDFIRLLRENGVTLLIDVRTIPRSRHNPQYNQEELPGGLAPGGIRYQHMPGLGGLRTPRRDSPNSGWRNESFRGFADYMQTDQFRANLAHLVEMAEAERVAIMCAETVPWRCHRSLIADALLVRGFRVVHLMASGRAQEHRLTPFAQVEGTTLRYPPPASPIQPDQEKDGP